MAATSTARVTLTVLMALTMVVSVAAMPIAAQDGGDGISVGGDDDPVGVSADNDSVSVDAGDETVSVSDDGVSTGDASSTADTSTSAEQGSVDGLAGAQDEDDEELPYNYSDVPFSLVPVDICQGPPDAEVPADPTDPPEPIPDPPSVPVDPTNPPDPPLTQCDVMNPYNPTFDPTDLPDDPSASYGVYRRDVGPGGAYLTVGAVGSPDSDYPGGFTIVGLEASQDGVAVTQYTNGDDGRRDVVVFTDVRHEPGTQDGSVVAETFVIGKVAGANVTCEGGACTFSQQVAPVGDQTFPPGGGGDGGDGGDGDDGSGSPAPTVPCNAPVGPGDAPEPPVDPTNPPEPIPDPPGVPVDPTNPPSAPVGPCDAYDPNDPPSTSPDPDAGYTVIQANESGIAVGGHGTYGNGGPGNWFIVSAAREDGNLSVTQFQRIDDGQKYSLLFSDVEYAPGTKKGQAHVTTSVIGKNAGADIVCNGQECVIDQSVAPAGPQAIPTGGGSGGDGGDGDEGGPLPSMKPPAAIPCSPPVGPGDAPVDPTNPPEPIPVAPPEAPVDPAEALAPCDAYDPNDPPNANPDPRYDYGAYQVGQNGVVVGGGGWYNPSAGGNAIVGVIRGDDWIGVTQYARGEDGQKPFMTFVNAGVDPNSVTRIGLTGYQLESDTVIDVDAFGKDTGASVVCDGEFCYINQSAAPVENQRFRIATEDADESESVGETMTTWAEDTSGASAPASSSTSTDSTSSSDGSTGTSDVDGSNAATDAGDATAIAADGPTAASSAPVGSATAVDFPSALSDGLPGAGDTSEALIGLV